MEKHEFAKLKLPIALVVDVLGADLMALPV
jgi:hypothetical protein